jgi:hypothetical protein
MRGPETVAVHIEVEKASSMVLPFEPLPPR